MKIAVITMFYNEHLNLPIWLGYYGKLFGKENLFVFDHGSPDNFADICAGTQYVKLPRTPFDDPKRTKFISNFHNGLLNFYDYVIYVDCDELIVPDPIAARDLRSYLEDKQPEYVTCTGVNITHLPNHEPDDFNPSKPVLSQRRFCRFVSPMCKSLIARVPVTWTPGFHALIGKEKRFDKRLFLFHLKRLDQKEALMRLTLTRALDWGNPEGTSTHHRMEDEALIKHFAALGRMPLNIDDAFDFGAEVEQVASGQQLHSPMMHKIPDRFVGMF